MGDLATGCVHFAHRMDVNLWGSRVDCSRWNNGSPRCQILIPTSCDCITLPGKWDFADVIKFKDLEMRSDSGLSRWALSITSSLTVENLSQLQSTREVASSGNSTCCCWLRSWRKGARNLGCSSPLSGECPQLAASRKMRILVL